MFVTTLFSDMYSRTYLPTSVANTVGYSAAETATVILSLASCDVKEHILSCRSTELLVSFHVSSWN